MSNARNVIVHYHLFKNAGSSIEHLLKFNFADRWMPYDCESPGAVIPSVDLEKLIADNPHCDAFSSHQIVPPLPKIEGNVFPIVFLRDPIDRVKSAYLFEWKKQLGLEQPKGTLAEYIKEKFQFGRRNSIEEFQTVRLSNQQREGAQNHLQIDDDDLLRNAKSFIQSLEFVGIVDEFDRSIELLYDYLLPAFPNFEKREFRSNVLQDLSLTRQQKRTSVREEIGPDLFEELIERNRLDEVLYQTGRAHFEALYSLRNNNAGLKSA